MNESKTALEFAGIADCCSGARTTLLFRQAMLQAYLMACDDASRQCRSVILCGECVSHIMEMRDLKSLEDF